MKATFADNSEKDVTAIARYQSQDARIAAVTGGTTVTLADTETGDARTYTLVGQEEADFKKGKISVQSPVGKALIGHKVGDVVTIKTPAKTVEFEIQEIQIASD